MYGARTSQYSRSFDYIEDANRLGEIIAEQNCILTISASTGFPFWVAKGASAKGGQVIGFSPATNEEEHHQVYHLPTKYMDMIIYSGFGFVGANLLLSRSSDAIIFGYGGAETIHDFWVAFQENKPIGILRGDWDTDEILFNLLKDYEGEFDQSRIIFDNDPKRLVQQLIKRAKKNRAQAYQISS